MTEEQRREEILNKLPKPSDYPKVLVSNDNDTWHERTLLMVADGKYICVHYPYEENFENTGYCKAQDWKYMKNIPELNTKLYEENKLLKERVIRLERKQEENKNTIALLEKDITVKNRNREYYEELYYTYKEKYIVCNKELAEISKKKSSIFKLFKKCGGSK